MFSDDASELSKYLRVRNDYIRNKGLAFCRVDSILEGDTTLDMDVFLPSIGKNLQRPLVWTQLQKEQFILSLYIERYLPPYAVVHFKSCISKPDHFQVIDGKQRLSTIISFAKDDFSVTFPNNKSYFFSDLPKDFKLELRYKYLVGDVAYHYEHEPVTDEQKIEWFKFINFAGTRVELDHLNSLKRSINAVQF